MFCVVGATVSVFTRKIGQVHVRLGHSGETFILGLWPLGCALLFVIFWGKKKTERGKEKDTFHMYLQTALLSDCL